MAPIEAAKFVNVWEGQRELLTGETITQQWTTSWCFIPKFDTDANVLTGMAALFNAEASLIHASQSLVQQRFTPSQGNYATQIVDYAPGAKPGAVTGDTPQQGEVVLLTRALMGRNSKNRQYFLTKHIHCVTLQNPPSTPWPNVSGVVDLITWQNFLQTIYTGGYGLGNLADAYWCDPAGNMPIQAPAVSPVLTTRQMRRSWKVKKVS